MTQMRVTFDLAMLNMQGVNVLVEDVNVVNYVADLHRLEGVSNVSVEMLDTTPNT